MLKHNHLFNLKSITNTFFKVPIHSLSYNNYFSFSNQFISKKQSIICTRFNIQYQFAKISKKQAQKIQKNKEKQKIKSTIQDTSTIDLNIFQSKFQQVLSQFSQQLSKVRAGKLDKTSFQSIYVKIHNTSFPISDLAQIAPQSVNTCIISPYDTEHLDLIDKTVRVAQSSYQVTKKDKSIIVNQPQSSMKELKQKMLVKTKKLVNNCKQKLSKQRSKCQDDLKKYKKIIPQERYKIAQKQLKQIYEKISAQVQKIAKQKQKQLSK